MFNSIGKKIQNVVGLVFGLSIIGYVFLGLCVWSLLKSLMGEQSIHVAFVVVGIGLFKVWLGQLKLYAYGKIAQCCEEQSAMMQNMLMVMKQNMMMPPATGKKCKKCGSSVGAGANFCTVCGMKNEGM